MPRTQKTQYYYAFHQAYSDIDVTLHLSMYCTSTIMTKKWQHNNKTPTHNITYCYWYLKDRT